MVPAIWVDSMQTIDPPLDDGQVINGELQYQPSGPIQVPYQPAKFPQSSSSGCFILVVKNACGLDVSSNARAQEQLLRYCMVKLHCLFLRQYRLVNLLPYLE